MTELHRSICRQCINQCAIEVVTSQGAVQEVRGVPSDPVYAGHTCEKGRSQGRLLAHPNRLLTSLKRGPDGQHRPISSEAAMDEIAERLLAIRGEAGADAIAAYAGTAAFLITAQTAFPMYHALLDAIGTPMRFDPNTIDKGGKSVAASFHGTWRAPSQGFDRPEAILLIGINPWQTYTGFPAGSPKRWLQDTLADGCRLIVIDPRRTHVAAHADWHLQPRPGHDVGILSAMIKIVVTEGLCDDAFVTDHVAGVPDLTELLRDVEVEQICDAAGIDGDDLRAATRAYATAGRGYAMAGTGPNMGGRGTLVEYLVLVLETLLGHWLRAGETVAAPPVLTASYPAVAEAVDPDESWGMEPRLVTRGLRMTRAGLPTAGAADEMIGGRIRALISWSGNPVAAFPDQPRVLAGLEQLDLLVQIDPWYSQTARLADYVIAPTMPLEVAVTTAGTEMITRKGTGYGFGAPYGNYSSPVVARPPGSDLVEEWEFFYGILKRLGGPVELMPFAGGDGAQKVVLVSKPTTDELIELMSVGSRVPLDVVKARGAGGVHPDDPIVVQPPSGCSPGRLHVSHPVMMDDLREELGRLASSSADAAGRVFHLVCRRANHILNTTVSDVSRREHPPYNPVFLNPADMEAGGIEAGASVRIESSLGAITAIAQADMNLRAGVASMAFAFGGSPVAVDDPEVRDHPTVNELISAEEFFDPYTGQPRMTGVPVDIRLATTG